MHCAGHVATRSKEFSYIVAVENADHGQCDMLFVALHRVTADGTFANTTRQTLSSSTNKEGSVCIHALSSLQCILYPGLCVRELT